MKKKALMNASVASMIYKFNMNNIDILEELGYQVDIACNFGKENPISQEQIDDFRSILKKKNIKVYETSCPRSIFAVGRMVKAYKQLKKIACEGNYDLVHTQSPIGGVVCRLAFRKFREKGTKVIYQAHGFHFFKGAPLFNWLIFYPIEKFCSRFTDVLITINKEDYKIAKTKFHAKRVEYVPGVGIDLSRFRITNLDKRKKRKELNIPDGKTWVLCVGELIERKNHRNLIKAVAQIEGMVLTIAGKGRLLEKLQNLVAKLHVEDRVRFLGYRNDISELCEAADVFAFPSYQEGLPVALMEAMAIGMPVVCSNVRGNVDLIDNGKGGYLFDPDSVEEMVDSLNKITRDNLETYGKYNKEKIVQFGLTEVTEKNKELYSSICEKK